MRASSDVVFVGDHRRSPRTVRVSSADQVPELRMVRALRESQHIHRRCPNKLDRNGWSRRLAPHPFRRILGTVAPSILASSPPLGDRTPASLLVYTFQAVSHIEDHGARAD
jgi:hypothetical protein